VAGRIAVLFVSGVVALAVFCFPFDLWDHHIFGDHVYRADGRIFCIAAVFCVVSFVSDRVDV
jgi:hypothetical protein